MDVPPNPRRIRGHLQVPAAIPRRVRAPKRLDSLPLRTSKGLTPILRVNRARMPEPQHTDGGEKEKGKWISRRNVTAYATGLAGRPYSLEWNNELEGIDGFESRYAERTPREKGDKEVAVVLHAKRRNVTDCGPKAPPDNCQSHDPSPFIFPPIDDVRTLLG